MEIILVIFYFVILYAHLVNLCKKNSTIIEMFLFLFSFLFVYLFLIDFFFLFFFPFVSDIEVKECSLV